MARNQAQISQIFSNVKPPHLHGNNYNSDSNSDPGLNFD